MMVTHVSLGAHCLLLLLGPATVNPACFMVWNGCLLRSTSAYFLLLTTSSFLFSLVVEKGMFHISSYAFQLPRESSSEIDSDTMKSSNDFAGFDPYIPVVEIFSQILISLR